MNILVIFNDEKPNGSLIAQKVNTILENEGLNVQTEVFNRFSEVIIKKSTDAVVVIGGDGTIIKVAKAAALIGCPVLGINAGRLGYLASVSCDNLEVLRRLKYGDYTIENRCMLRVECVKNGKVSDFCDCLNDAVISKDGHFNMIDLELQIGNDTIDYRADGIIVATPTGSTAYSLSAGGPVVDPKLNCMILTPVCPHTLVTRSLVTDGDTPVKLTVNNTDWTDIQLLSDGRTAFSFGCDNELWIKLSDISAKFIKLNDVSVYKVLSQKTDSY